MNNEKLIVNNWFCSDKIKQGGGVAAPIAGQILGDVLPYLEIKKQEEETEEISVPDVKGLSLKEAKETLKGFEIEVTSENEYTNESKVYKQIPEAGIEINNTGKIILYVVE